MKDVDFASDQITVRDGKGEKNRVTMLPASLKAELQKHLKTVKRLHEEDLGTVYGRVSLPYALARKYPSADAEWGWQYAFPAPTTSGQYRNYWELLGHQSVKTTMIDTHVLNRGGRGVRSPMDVL